MYAYLGRLGHFGWRIWQEGNRPSAEQYAVWLGGLALSLTATFVLGNLAIRLLREARAPRAEDGGTHGGGIPEISPASRRVDSRKPGASLSCTRWADGLARVPVALFFVPPCDDLGPFSDKAASIHLDYGADSADFDFSDLHICPQGLCLQDALVLRAGRGVERQFPVADTFDAMAGGMLKTQGRGRLRDLAASRQREQGRFPVEVTRRQSSLRGDVTGRDVGLPG